LVILSIALLPDLAKQSWELSAAAGSLGLRDIQFPMNNSYRPQSEMVLKIRGSIVTTY
jgi:hypothetical protein